MRSPASRLMTALVVAVLVALLPASVAGTARVRPLARNVILLVDDGGGYNQHELGSLWDTGLSGAEAFQDFPVQLGVTTYSYGPLVGDPGSCGPVGGYDPTLAWSDWSYVMAGTTDSAAAATAMATGTKTYNKSEGIGCHGETLTNVVEAFEADDRSTGVVTSVPFDDATPASFVAHEPIRDQYMALTQDMLARSALDVVMGTGHPWFDSYGRPVATPAYTYIDQATFDAIRAGTFGGDADRDLEADPWTLVDSLDGIRGLATGPTPERVFGLAPVRFGLQYYRGPIASRALPPFAYPLNATVPSLAELTSAALNVLDNDPDGFFLMVEGGALDKAISRGWNGRAIEEEVFFDRAVDAVLAWVDENSNWGETLVIVTGDHETGYLWGTGSGPTADGPAYLPLVNNGAGVVPGYVFASSDHTNSLVPVYAKGAAARLLRGLVDGIDPVRGPYVDNTDLHTLIVRATGV